MLYARQGLIKNCGCGGTIRPCVDRNVDVCDMCRTFYVPFEMTKCDEWGNPLSVPPGLRFKDATR